jgi:hypothetical protein
MAKLVVFGQVQSWNKELEIKVNGGNGLDCYITLNNGEQQIRRNCTEFHHRFDSMGSVPASAFESDIHSTGGTIDLDKVVSIEVVMASKLHEDYR